MSSDNASMSDKTRNAIDLADSVLMAAAESAKTVPEDVSRPIAKAIKAAKDGSLTPQEIGAFWAAFTRLCEIIRPVSLSTLRPDYLLGLKHQRHTYVISSLLLLLLILPLSVCGFLVTSLNADVAKEAEATCAAEPGLGCEQPWQLGQPNPTVGNDGLKKGGSNLSYVDYALYTDVKWLNRLTYPHPYEERRLDDAYKCLEATSDKSRKVYTCNTRSHSDADIDYPATFEGVIYFARRIKFKSDLTYGILGAYVLPPLYAMLGACAFGLRNLVGIRTPFAAPAVSVSIVRVLLAALADFVVGFFTDITKGLALSPLATAFLVGYAADAFFSFLDSLIQSAKTSSPATTSS